MRVFGTLDDITPGAFSRGSAVAIGKFDGVHLGHQAILGRLTEVARDRDLESVAFTFANNPLTYLRPEACPLPLMSPEQRLTAIAAEGVDACVMVPFDEALASLPAEEYVERILVEQLRARHLIVGSDFRFGYRGAGDVELLQRLGGEHGFSVEQLADVEFGALGRVSSTAVRQAILHGDVARAGRMLGRAATVEGEVVRGDARGRELGFPTANLGGAVSGLVPADGVYAGWAVIDGGRYPAAISVGTNPTFTPAGVSRVEAYLLDFSGDLYGKQMRVEFVERLRGMVAFTGVDDLIVQMTADVDTARQILAG